MAAGNRTTPEPQHFFFGAQGSGLDAQKKSFFYRERREEERQAFCAQLEQIPEADRVYVDEAGVEDTLSYAWGWSAKGERCPGERLGHRTQRVSMAAAWCGGEVLAPLTFEGYCDSELIEAWCAQELAPILRSGQVVILDNASFHRHQTLGALLEEYGCTLLPLPSYSPDLNKIEPLKIEPLWNTLKRKIELDAKLYPSFQDKVDAAFL